LGFGRASVCVNTRPLVIAMNTFMRASIRLGLLSTICVGVLLAPTKADALVINPTFGVTGSASPFTQAQRDTINSAIALYQSTFNDPITVNITFNNMTSGLGQSNTNYTQTPYAAVLAALIADSSSADDTAAMAKLASNPFGGTQLYLAPANFKALGLDASGFTGPDSVIGLNAGICFTGHANPVGGSYDLYAVACHEIDEALGTVSGVGFSESVADLYRYDAAGARNFSVSTTTHVFFSINGTTDIVEYNQFGRTGGDWGDWKVNSPAQVQDWQGTAGQVINGPVNELRLLDVVGYTRAPVPEPASMVALGLGVMALVRRRKSK